MTHKNKCKCGNDITRATKIFRKEDYDKNLCFDCLSKKVTKETIEGLDEIVDVTMHIGLSDQELKYMNRIKMDNDTIRLLELPF